MKNLGRWILTVVCVVLLVLVVIVDRHYHGSPEVRADVPTAVGEIGGKLPDFTLPDIAGNPVRLSQFYGKGPLVLTFERSLDW